MREGGRFAMGKFQWAEALRAFGSACSALTASTCLSSSSCSSINRKAERGLHSSYQSHPHRATYGAKPPDERASDFELATRRRA